VRRRLGYVRRLLKAEWSVNGTEEQVKAKEQGSVRWPSTQLTICLDVRRLRRVANLSGCAGAFGFGYPLEFQGEVCVDQRGAAVHFDQLAGDPSCVC
jgi:hypothetical protein